MKQKLTILAILLFAITMLNGDIFAQDTVNVPAFFPDSGEPALLHFILGDTTETGERVNENRIYKLGRDSIYIIDGQMLVDFDLKLVTDDDPTEATRPPIIVRGKYDDGVNVKDPFKFVADSLDVYFKNIIFTGVDLDRKTGDWTGPALFASDETRAVYENCVFNQWTWVIYSTGENNSIYLRDCIFRNNYVTWHPFVGQQFYCGNVPLDTLEITNCSYFNCAAFFVGLEFDLYNHVRIEHNTFNTSVVDMLRIRNVTNATIASNLFYGPHAIGETEYERTSGWYTSDEKHASIIDLDVAPTDLMQDAGLTEADRNVYVGGNAYFWPQAITNFWAGIDSVNAIAWMNAETQAMFDDASSYPGLVAENNVEADPQFTNTAMDDWMTSEIVNYATKYRSGVSAPERNYDAYTNNGELLMLQWPLPETMAYANASLMTAGHDGLPVGDLNWFPEKRAEWEAQQNTSVSDFSSRPVPTTFELAQNYPNPFNPETTISYSISEKADVNLSIFNVMGQKIQTLVNKNQAAGSYSMKWNGTDRTGNMVSSGIYFYQIQVGNASQTYKMLLTK